MTKRKNTAHLSRTDFRIKILPKIKQNSHGIRLSQELVPPLTHQKFRLTSSSEEVIIMVSIGFLVRSFQRRGDGGGGGVASSPSVSLFDG